MEHIIVFTRVESSFPTTIGICRYHSDNLHEPLKTLKKAVSMWINSTNEGAEAYEDSSEDFNIGDLACYEEPNLLADWGITALDVRVLEPSQHSTFDHHLYDPDLLDENP